MLRCLLVCSLLLGCAPPEQAGLSPDETRWCDTTAPSVMLEAARELGLSNQEMVLVLDDVDLEGPSIGRRDPRYMRVCKHAFARR